MADERMSELKYISTKAKKRWKAKRTKMEKTEQNIQGLWDNCKRCNIHVNEKTKMRRKKRTKEALETVVTKNFSKLMSDTKPKI